MGRKINKDRQLPILRWSECTDLNRGPLVPQTSALTRLSYTPRCLRSLAQSLRLIKPCVLSRVLLLFMGENHAADNHSLRACW